MQTYEIQITIGDIVFNDFTDRTTFYKVDNPRELISTLNTERTETARQGEHGTNDSLSRYGSRTLPFSGEIVAPSIAARVAMERVLQRTLALSAIQDYATNDGYILVQFKLEDGTLVQCYAKILQPPTFSFREEIPGRHLISRFSFAMVAKDPRLYSQTLKSETGEETFHGTSFTVVEGVSPKVPFQLYENTSITATCDNDGTFDAPPVITISGPTVSPTITNETTGKYIELTDLELEDGESVEINIGKRTIEKNDGTDLSGYFGLGSTWFVLIVGENELTLLDDSPSLIEATALIQWRDTFI